MRIRRIWLALSSSIIAMLVFACAPLHAQSSQRGQPTTPFGPSEFARLKWLDGKWIGTAPGESPVYERIRYANDSTIEITYFRDSSFAQESGTGRVYLSVGRVYHTFGGGRWGASHVDSAAVFFVPQVNAHNTFAWNLVTPNSWTSTVRSGLSGRERVTVYNMRRASASP